LCQYFDTCLFRLIEDIEQNPNDPSFEKIVPAATSKGQGAAAVTSLYDVFLSYSTQDKDEAREIHGAISKTGKKCFLAEKSLQPGDKFEEEIRNALEGSREVWILASPNSNKSAWVQREVAAAWALRKRIVPIMLRCGPADLPEILGGAHAIDYHRVKDHIMSLR
jgi:hypothetical protein